MPYNKSPGNDGLTKEFQETFWEEIKIPLCDSITRSYQNGELSISQKQAVIKLIEKKDENKKLIKNQRQLISKVLAGRLKKPLPYLISKHQTVKGIEDSLAKNAD